MADIPDTTGKQPQGQPRQELSRTTPPRLTHRQKWEESWLARLRDLPDPIYASCVTRLARGTTAREIAAWILALPLPIRAKFKDVTSLRSMEDIVQVLRLRVRAAKKRQQQQMQMRKAEQAASPRPASVFSAAYGVAPFV